MHLLVIMNYFSRSNHSYRNTGKNADKRINTMAVKTFFCCMALVTLMAGCGGGSSSSSNPVEECDAEVSECGEGDNETENGALGGEGSSSVDDLQAGSGGANTEDGNTDDEPASPPSNEDVFEPNPGSKIDSDSLNVSINALSELVKICFTLDGSEPAISEGVCSGDSSQTLIDYQIALDCSGRSSDLIAVKIAYIWPQSNEQVIANATYELNCPEPVLDDDSDGVANNVDNCPGDANADQADTDENGIGDVCELGDGVPDADSDGRADETDNCVNVWNLDQLDADGDGIGDVCDSTPMGVAATSWSNGDLAEAFTRWKEQVQCEIRCTDPTGGGDMGTLNCPGGGSANWTVDLDILGGQADSIFTYSNCDFTTAEGDRLVVNGSLTQFSDFNGNGNEEGTVNITGGDYTGQLQSHTDFSNKLTSGGYYSISCTADFLETEDCAESGVLIDYDALSFECTGLICPQPLPTLDDSDDDGVYDDYDNCPDDSNADQANGDGDSLGDACDLDIADDADGDGVLDADDNCLNAANADQTDTDSDDEGDACDATPQGPDSDDDGITDLSDNCINDANPLQEDADGDDIGDACDSESFYLIKSSNGKCLFDGGDIQHTSSCDAGDLSQQWLLLTGTSPEVFQNVNSSKCISSTGSFAAMDMADCDVDSAAQQWSYDTTGDVDYPVKLHNGDDDFCIRTNGGSVGGTLWNCGFAEKFGIYSGGNFDNPPLQP